MDKVKVYLSARIAKDAHPWNNCVCNALDGRFEVFKPQDHNPCDVDHRHLPKSVYEMDLRAMQESDLGLLLSPYGRDCAWEVGWYSHSEKPIVLYIEEDTTWLRDWMIKGGVDLVAVCGDSLYERIKDDSIVANKICRLESRSQLSDLLSEVYVASLRARAKAARKPAASAKFIRPVPVTMPALQPGAALK
jgi:hypothetical protein